MALTDSLRAGNRCFRPAWVASWFLFRDLPAGVPFLRAACRRILPFTVA